MWAPEDYWTWADFQRLANNIGLMLTIIEVSKREKRSLPEVEERLAKYRAPQYAMVHSPELPVNYKRAAVVGRILDIWIQANLMEQFPPLVCNSFGNTVQSTPAIYAHADLLYWCPWDWDMSENSAYWGRIYKAELQQSGAFGFRFAVIYPNTGIITRKNHQIQLLSSGLHLDVNSGDAEKILKLLVEPFFGSAICWSKEGLPNEWVPLLESLPIDLTKEELSYCERQNELSAKKPKGRPAKWREAGEAYLELYKSGSHGNRHWEHVLREIQANYGITVSVDTLRTGIKRVQQERNQTLHDEKD